MKVKLVKVKSVKVTVVMAAAVVLFREPGASEPLEPLRVSGASSVSPGGEADLRAVAAACPLLLAMAAAL